MPNSKLRSMINTIEEDHQLVSMHMGLLKDVITTCLENDTSKDAQFLAQLEKTKEFFATKFASHLEEEELTLFPFLTELDPAKAALVDELRAEHDQINRRVQAFGDTLEVAKELEDRLPSAVKRDLATFGWELWHLLDDHAKKETQAVGELTLKLLSEE